MCGTAFNPGQMTEFTNNVNVALATALPRVAAKFGDPKAVLAGIKDKTEVLAGRLETSIEEVVKSMMALIRRPQRSVTLSAKREPDAYYQTREGLWVHGGFRSLVASKAEPVEVGATFKVNEDELGEAMTDAEIEAGLPKRHLFDESAVSAIAAELIESGTLDKAKWYLLYTSSCIVSVQWDRVDRTWSVRVWARDDRRWHAGACTLSPAN